MSVILDFADRLRAQLDIAEIVGRYVELRRAGTNLKGLCPFHREKSPSFTVSPDKQIYHCFGCHNGGDAIKFIQQIERLTWMEAVEHLAKSVNMALPERSGSASASPENKDEKEATARACAFAAQYFAAVLSEELNSATSLVRDYLQKRQLRKEEIEAFGLGFAPEAWTSFIDAAKRASVTPEQAATADLAIKHQSGRFYDRFRNRIIFPICDVQGKPVAFGGRIYQVSPEREEPKYVNSSETAIYRKGQVLYGLHLARTAIVQHDLVYVMEGYLDVIRAHQFGITNSVATCGTALTDEQAKAIKRFTQNVTFAYDGDEAGQKAMLRGTEILLQHGINVHVLQLPANHDPDSFLLEEGPDAFKRQATAAPGFFDHFLNFALSQFDAKTAEGKVNIAELLLPLLRRIGKSIAQSDYARRLADRLGVPQALITKQLLDNGPRTVDHLRETLLQEDRSTAPVEQMLMKIMVDCPDARAMIRKQVESHWIRDPQIRSWFCFICETPDEDVSWDLLFRQADDEKSMAVLRDLALRHEFCDKSERTINHVASRLRRHHMLEEHKLQIRQIEEFFSQTGFDQTVENKSRQFDQSTRTVSSLNFFLKQPGRRPAK